MQASKLIFAGLMVVAGLAPALPASAAAMTNNMPTKPLPAIVTLGCSAGHGDVAQTITITNTTAAAIAKGTKISWTLNASKGSQTLDAALAVGKTISDLAPPGNGGTCKASFLK